MNDEHGHGDTSDCLCGRNFGTVRGLREHLTKQRRRSGEVPADAESNYRPEADI